MIALIGNNHHQKSHINLILICHENKIIHNKWSVVAINANNKKFILNNHLNQHLLVYTFIINNLIQLKIKIKIETQIMNIKKKIITVNKWKKL